MKKAKGRGENEVVHEKRGREIIEERNQDFKGSYIVINFNSVRK